MPQEDRHLCRDERAIIMMISGVAAGLVSSPTMTSVPHMISAMPIGASWDAQLNGAKTRLA